jgi:hypothetical protein
LSNSFAREGSFIFVSKRSLDMVFVSRKPLNQAPPTTTRPQQQQPKPPQVATAQPGYNPFLFPQYSPEQMALLTAAFILMSMQTIQNQQQGQNQNQNQQPGQGKNNDYLASIAWTHFLCPGLFFAMHLILTIS